MNHKPGFIPIVIAVVIAAILVGGTTYGITSSKRNKIIKDKNVKIEELTQEMEDLKTQISRANFLPEKNLSTPSTPSVPSTPSSPKPTTPAAKPAIPATPAVPATPAQPANMKTWSGKLVQDKSISWYSTWKDHSLSFQYPKILEATPSNGDTSGVKLSNSIVMSPEQYGKRNTSNTSDVKNSLSFIHRYPPYIALDKDGIKEITVGGKQAFQFKHGDLPQARDERYNLDTIFTYNPKTITTYINVDGETIIVSAPLSAESVYQQIISSMKF